MKQLNFLKENNTPEYVTAEEQQLLHRLGNWNYFKTNPGNPWENSKFKESIQNIKIKDIIYLESPSNEKLSKLGDYIPKDEVNNDWDTNFPVCINYKGNIYLLDGHHRVELAKRAGKTTIKAALKNITSKYEDVIEETILNLLKEHTKKLLYESYSTNVIIVDIQPAYNIWCKHLMPQLCEFLNKQKGNTLIFFNGEDLNLDNKNSVINYYYDYGLSEEKIKSIEWKEKIYGYFRDLMDSDVNAKLIIKIIREIFLQKVNDSRDLSEEFIQYLYDKHSIDLENYPVFLPDFSFKLLKEYNNCYIGGGGKHECFREVTLLMNALNIKYKEMQKFIY